MKARFIAQGHKDREKLNLVDDVSTLRQSIIRLKLPIAAVKCFKIFSHDVTQAYLQSEDPFTSDVYVMPKTCDRQYFSMYDDQVLKLLKPLCGTSDGGGLLVHD